MFLFISVTFGGYFSSREQSGGYVNWTARIDILNTSGTIVATSTTRTFTNADGAEDQQWYYLSGSATLAPGNYFYRVYIGDFGNFDNASFNVCYTSLGAPDFDGDGIPNFLDLDSDGDGIPDVIEAGGTDANNDGKIDGFTDIDGDGFSDAVDGDVGNDGIAENSAGALIISGADTNGDGRADSWPNKNADRQGYPNFLDLDSDGDGILDLVEAGFSGTNGIANGTLGSDGWSNTIDALSALNLPNSDANGQPNYLDIDSDNDGITDNVEAQSTSSYKVPTDADIDRDGINDIYETGAQIGTYGGGGLTPYDYDLDGIPDYTDTDSDNDGAPDRNEGSDNNQPTFLTISQATIDASGDSDGDGLMDIFDNISIGSLTGNYYTNVTMSNMGPLGNFAGPTPSSSKQGLRQSDPLADRDWRNAAILPLHIVKFSVNYQTPLATLKWQVENELATLQYEVEVSTNGTDFNKVGVVSARNRGTDEYVYHQTLTNLNLPAYFFRIKQVDKDGKVFYSKVVMVKLNGVVAIKVSPNPFINNLQVAFNSSQKQDVIVTLYSMEGKKLTSVTQTVLQGTNAISLNDVGRLSSGQYIISVSNAGGQLFSTSVLKSQ